MSKKRGTPAPKRTKRSTAKEGRTAKPAHRLTWSVARNANRSVKERVAALAGMTRSVCDDSARLQAVLDILRDTKAPAQVRLAALRTLQAASFSVVKFNACRAEYLGALRSVTADPNKELRQRVLGILSREKDGYAQQQLLDGLREPDKALVPPEKALQLLSYDVHAEAYPVAREIIRKPPNPAARREALRLLAADATSAKVFERILRDKDEAPEIRQLSASALHALAPKALQTHAREILLDISEKPGIQATSLTALTQFGDQDTVATDHDLNKRVRRLKGRGASAKVKQGARRFLTKYGG